MYQQTTILGRVGKKPEMRYTPTGKPVTNFSVAVSEKYGDAENTIWFRVTTWNKQAEVCNQYVDKGMLVLIVGKLNADKNGNPKVFTKTDGSAGSNFELTAQNVKFLSRVEREEEPVVAGDEETISDDDFPF